MPISTSELSFSVSVLSGVHYLLFCLFRDIHVPFGAKRSYLMDPMQHGFRQEDLAQFTENGELVMECSLVVSW